jgi:hypothetical protein
MGKLSALLREKSNWLNYLVAVEATGRASSRFRH